jgi:NAD+ synthase
MFNANKVKDELVEWIREWFQQNGPDCEAIIGISGGKDSSVVAALCAEALGKERVFGVLMPDGGQSDIGDAYAICKFLGIPHIEVNIEDTTYAVLHSILRANREFRFSEQAMINLPPRVRMTTLYAISQTIGGRVACTDNLSESWIGYSTRWGDNVGDFAPLANLTSDEVIAVGRACGLPDWAIYKAPSDGLTGKTDEDNFGFTYAFLNHYIRTGEWENDIDSKEKVDNLHKKNKFKLTPIPSFPYFPSLINLEGC